MSCLPEGARLLDAKSVGMDRTPRATVVAGAKHRQFMRLINLRLASPTRLRLRVAPARCNQFRGVGTRLQPPTQSTDHQQTPQRLQWGVARRRHALAPSVNATGEPMKSYSIVAVLAVSAALVACGESADSPIKTGTTGSLDNPAVSNVPMAQ